MILTSSFTFLVIVSLIAVSIAVILIVSTFSKYKARLRAFEDQIDDNDTFISTLTLQLSEIKNHNAILQQKIDTLQYQHTKYLDKLKPEYRKIFNQLMETIDNLDEMTAKFQQSEEAYDSLLDDNRELEHEIHELSTENLTFRDEIALLKSKLLEHKQETLSGVIISKETNHSPSVNFVKSINNDTNNDTCSILNAEVITSNIDMEHARRLQNNSIQENND